MLRQHSTHQAMKVPGTVVMVFGHQQEPESAAEGGTVELEESIDGLIDGHKLITVMQPFIDRYRNEVVPLVAQGILEDHGSGAGVGRLKTF